MPERGPVIPDLDVWLRAFSRQHADRRVAAVFTERVRARELLLMGWVRQGLLTRVRDDQQFRRLAWILSGWPDLQLRPDDHERGAQLVRLHAVDPWRALMWAVSVRLRARIWTTDARWQVAAERGCPVVR